MSHGPSKTIKDRRAFAQVLASPGMFPSGFLPAERAEWRGERFTLGRARRRMPKDVYVGVRMLAADRRNIDRSRERAVQHDLSAVVKSIIAMRAMPELAGVALSGEIVTGRDPATGKRVRFGLVQPASGEFTDEAAAAAKCHAVFRRAIWRSGFAVSSAPPFQPGDGFAALGAWAEGVRLQPSRLHATLGWCKAAAAAAAAIFVLSMIPPVWNRLRASGAAAYDYVFPTLGVPQSVRASSGSHGNYTDRIELSWNPVDKATGYAIYRGADMSVPIATVSGNGTTTYRDRPQDPADPAAKPPIGERIPYAVRATTLLSHSHLSEKAVGCRGIESPTNLQASQGSSPECVEVMWDEVPGAEEYEVECGGQAQKCKKPPCRYVGSRAAQKCQFTVCARKGEAVSAPSAAVEGFRGLAAPGPVRASDGTEADGVRLDWQPGEGASSYRVSRRCADGTCKEMTFDVAGTSSWRDASAVPGKTYEYVVTPRNQELGIEGESSAPEEGWRGFEPVVTKATDGEFTDRVRVTWNRVPGATGYEIFRDGSAEPLMRTSDEDVTEFTDEEAVVDTKHSYAVRPVTSRSDVPASDPDIGWRALAAPAGLEVSRGYTDRVEVTWKPNPAAKCFVVSRDGRVIHATSGPDDSRFEDRTAAIGVQYSYAVSSEGAGTGVGLPSEAREGYRYLEKPTAVKATATPKGVLVSWQPVEGAIRYEVWRSDNQDAPQGSVKGKCEWIDNQPAAGPVTYRVFGANDFTGPPSADTQPVSPRGTESAERSPPSAERAEGAGNTAE